MRMISLCLNIVTLLLIHLSAWCIVPTWGVPPVSTILSDAQKAQYYFFPAAHEKLFYCHHQVKVTHGMNVGCYAAIMLPHDQSRIKQSIISFSNLSLTRRYRQKKKAACGENWKLGTYGASFFLRIKAHFKQFCSRPGEKNFSHLTGTTTLMPLAENIGFRCHLYSNVDTGFMRSHFHLCVS